MGRKEREAAGAEGGIGEVEVGSRKRREGGGVGEGPRKKKEKREKAVVESMGDDEENCAAGEEKSRTGKKSKERKEKKQRRPRCESGDDGGGDVASEVEEGEGGSGKRKAKTSKKKIRKGSTASTGEEAKGDATKSANEGRVVVGSGPMETFDLAPFSAELLKGLKAAFQTPTPIQAQAWPILIAGADLVAVAKTGSGKTLAFLLPALHAYAGPSPSCDGPKVLVLAPTRELALQINGECDKFAPLVGSSSVAVYGGAAWGEQLSALKFGDPTIVVATPGRLCDFLTKRDLNLGGAAYVVLDEADRMLDMGFEPQVGGLPAIRPTYQHFAIHSCIKQIFAALPAKRQTLCFTATWPKSVRKLAATWLRSGDDLKQVFLDTAPDAELQANKAISQRFIQATDDEKDEKMYNLLCELDAGSRVVVFANAKRRVDACSRIFAEFGSVAIHGDKAQHERDAALAAFSRGDAPLMFATDVAARGLDIKGVTHVMNFDMARDVESYVHRIGRTGRAGELGEAVTFWNPDYDKECTPALCKIARSAGQEVPEWLAKHERSKATKSWRVDKAEAALAAAVVPAS